MLVTKSMEPDSPALFVNPYLKSDVRVAQTSRVDAHLAFHKA